MVVIAIVAVSAVSLGASSIGVRDGATGQYGSLQPSTDKVLLDLQVRAAYDDDEVFFMFEWETEQPGFHHDFLVYEGGEWVVYGGEGDGSAFPLNEDRVALLIDDGSVDGFEHYGGFMTVYSHTRQMSPQDVSEEELIAVFGENARDDLRKMLPETMEDTSDWRTRVSADEIDRQRNAGYFLDLWHWRAHRANPIGWSDFQYVLDHRSSQSGSGVASTNFDSDLQQPQLMFDPDVTGQHAMSFDRINSFDYSYDDFYFLSEETSAPFDPDHDWQEGDAIPRRILSVPEGTRGTIFAQATALTGSWQVELRRALDVGDPQTKTLEDFGLYHMAPSVHAGGTAGRWHYVGMPVTLGLGRDAEVEAVHFTGDRPDWSSIEPTTVTLFYPGVIAWDYLTDRTKHAGADKIEDNASFASAHTPEKMAFYALESEFRSEIIRQWWLTGIVWLFFVIGASVSVYRLTRGASTNPERATTPTEEVV